MTTSRTLLFAGAVLFCTATATAQAPANDDCINAQVVGLGLTSFDTTLATDGTGLALDPMVCSFGFTDEQLYQDVWFSYTPAVTDDYDIASVNNGNANFDSRIAVYNQSTCPDVPANVIACDDDAGPAFEASLASVPLTGGATYLIRVGSFSATTSEQPAALSISLTPPPPAHDDCANALTVMVGTTPLDTQYTSLDGTALDPLVCDMDASADERIYNDLWFLFTAPTTDSYDFHTNNGLTFDTRLAIYNQSTCPDNPANVLGCDDDGLGFASIASANLTMGSTYLVRVGSATPADRGVGNLTIEATPSVPANDDCGNAAVAVLGLTSFDSRSATDGLGLPLDPLVCDMGTFGDEQIYQDVWFTFTPAVSGFYNLGSVNSGGVSFDSRIAVYNQSTCPDNPANVIACDDDSGPILEALVTSVSMTGGTTYLVRVGSYSAATTEEPAALEIAAGPSPAANDDCANAIALPSTYATTAFDNTIASTDGASLLGFCLFNPFDGDGLAHEDVWFTYTPAVGGCTYISTFGLCNFDSRIAIYSSTSCPDDPASIVACSDDEVQPIAPPYEAGMDIDLVAGTTYLIRIGNYGLGTVGGPGSITIAAGPVAVGNDAGMQTGAPGCAPAPAFNEFCFGDGGNQAGCTNCPCSNNAPIGSGGGCLNSSGDGIQLNPSGSTSVSLPSGDTTDLRFGADGAPANAFCILNSGDALAPGNPANPCFGLGSGAQAAAFDGLRCAITNTRRHGGRSADANGDVGVTNNPWGGEGGPPVGLAVAGGGFIAGQTRYFQIINRDDALAVCMRGLNTSQAVEVTFTP